MRALLSSALVCVSKTSARPLARWHSRLHAARGSCALNTLHLFLVAFDPTAKSLAFWGV